jgi:endonuclease/exonuclease/phosphatase family metal-dependent hydrolase
MRVLAWNVYHGRSVPPAGRSLRREYEAALAGWDWDVALLQEVPPWWAGSLARACGAQARRALTSRNVLPPVQAWLGETVPDLIKSWGGGSNLILVRELGIAEHREHLVRRRPERRVVHAVRLSSGVWVANLHASVHERAAPDVAAARAWALIAAREEPLVFGGDFNTPRPPVEGFAKAAAGRIDFVFARGVSVSGRGEVLDAGGLSDHRPIRATLSARRDAT